MDCPLLAASPAQRTHPAPAPACGPAPRVLAVLACSLLALDGHPPRASAAEPVAAGAPDARTPRLTTSHWSFQPVKRPEVRPSNDPWVRGAIDEFILAKLRAKGLTPSREADRNTLVRRLFLVMHGLPPSPAEVEAFVNDESPEAYERLVERVLASPRYGERWARHWLDVVRYADSNGFETNRERKTAWPYRDYVIAAFNADKPYDQFVREQLAGDALGEDAATGFLVAGPHDIVKSPDISLSLMQREDELADMVNTTGTAFIGLTMGCARCHDHKFDPILQRDYYAMQAVFAGVTHGERPWRRTRDPAVEESLAVLRKTAAEKENKLAGFRIQAAQRPGPPAGTGLRPPVNARVNVEEFPPVEASAVRFIARTTNGGEFCLDELEIYDVAGCNVALASSGARPTASGTLPGYAIHRLEHLNDGLHGNSRSWIANTSGSSWAQISFPGKCRITRVVWSRDREEHFRDRVATDYRIEAETAPMQWTTVAGSDDRAPFVDQPDPNAFLQQLAAPDAAAARREQAELSELRAKIAQLDGGGQAWLGTFSQPSATHRLHRGDPMQKRETVAPDAPIVMGSLGMAEDEPERERRLRLARWITSPAHPLTARVLVNRLWQYVFGQGLVDTPSDFGVNGSRPTHPELLDWMASEFVSSGWSIKHLQRMILLSATFRQSPAPRPEALTVDADARLLWRYPPRRIEAEAIRDSLLAVSGALNPAAGGPGFYLVDVEEENVMHYHPKETFTPAEFRRMVYQFRIRQTHDGVFGSFDCPDGSQAMPRRSRSNTPLQALNLFNGGFVLEQANLLAARLRREAGSEPEHQVARAFELAYARGPDAFELDQSVALIRGQGLEAFCRALFNTSEFLFVF